MTDKKSTTNPAKSKASTARDVLVQVQTRGNKSLTARAQARLDAIAVQEKIRKQQRRQWLLDVIDIANQYKAAKQEFRLAKYRIIGAVYEKYLEIESSGEQRNDFYGELRAQLIEYGFKVQKNTPDAGLLLRLVLGVSANASSINQYVNVLHAAQEFDIREVDFVDWLKKITISKAATQLPEAIERKKDRLERARTLVLHYLDWRETHPKLFGLKPLLAHTVDQHVTRDTHLVVMIGTAVRQMDRGSDYADIHVSHIMPPNLEIEIKIIDKWARLLEPQLEKHEADFGRLSEADWAQQMESELWVYDVLEAERYVQRTQLQNFTKRFENEQAFEENARAFLESRGGFVEKKSKTSPKTAKKP